MGEIDHKDFFQNYETFFEEFLGFKPFRDFRENFRFLFDKKIQKEYNSLKKSIRIIKKSLKNEIFLNDYELNFHLTKIGMSEAKIEDFRNKKKRDSAIKKINEKNFSKNHLIKALILFECLSSFFPQGIYQEPYIKALILRMLIFGDIPIDNKIRNGIIFFRNSLTPSLEKQIGQHHLLFSHYKYLDYIGLPINQINNMFKTHAFAFAELRNFFKGKNEDLIDAIIDDGFYSWNWDIPYNRDFLWFIFEANDYFNIHQLPFRSQDFFDYLSKIDYSKKNFKPSWFENNNNQTIMWTKLKESLIGFNYKINLEMLGATIINYYVVINENTDLEQFRFLLKLTQNSVSYYSETRQQNKRFQRGFMYIQLDYIKELINYFESLKNYNLIDDYAISRYEVFNDYYGDNMCLEKDQYKKIRNIFHYERKLCDIRFEIIDIIILTELKRAPTGIGLRSISEFLIKIREVLRSTKSRIEKLNFNNFKNSHLLEQVEILPDLIFPKEFYPIEVRELNTAIIFLIKLIGIGATKHYIHLIKEIYSITSRINFIDPIIKLINPKNLEFKKVFPEIEIESFIDYIQLNKQLQSIREFVKFILRKLKNINNTHVLNEKNYDWNYWILKNLQIIQQNKNKKFLTELEKLYDYFETLLQTKYVFNRNLPKIIDEFLSQTNEEMFENISNRLEFYLKNKIITPRFTAGLPHSKLYQAFSIFVKQENCKNLPLKIEELTDFLPIASYNTYSFQNFDWHEKWININIKILPGFEQFYEKSLKYLFDKKIIFSTSLSETSTSYHDLFAFFDYENQRFKNFDKNYRDSLKFAELIKNEPNKRKKWKIFRNHDETRFLEENDRFNKKKIQKQLSIYKKEQEEIFDNKLSEKELMKNLNFSEELLKYKTKSLIIDKANRIWLKKVSIIEKIEFIPNWEIFNFNYYIFQFTPQKLDSNSKKFMLCPGSFKIEKNLNHGIFSQNFIHYIFPKDDPAYNIFNYSKRMNYFSCGRLMKVIHIFKNFDYHYQMGLKNWKTSYRTLNILMNKIIFNKQFFESYSPNFKDFFVSSTTDAPISPKDVEFKVISDLWSRDLRKFAYLKPYFDSYSKIFNKKIIAESPVLKFSKLGLYYCVYIFVGPLTKANQTNFKKITSFFPYSEIYCVEYIEMLPEDRKSKKDIGFFIKLRLPISNTNELYWLFENFVKRLKIKNFDFNPYIIEDSAENYTEDFNFHFYNPFYSHIWNSQIWKRNRLFNTKGHPLNQRERQIAVKENINYFL